jgi:DNA repair protein RadA/Sms
LHLETEDIFVNVAGGIKVEDPAADLAVALAVNSAFRDQVMPADTVVLGEVGLAGEIRSISQVAVRIHEAEKLGFRRCLLPKNNYRALDYKKGAMELLPAAHLSEALGIVAT